MDENSTALHNSIRNEDIEQCSLLIGAGADINAVDDRKRRPIHLAAWKGNLPIVELLISAKCRLDERALDDFTALHFAALSGNENCCRIIAEKCRKLVHAKVSKGKKTALHLAASKGHIGCARVLINCGSDLFAKTSNGKTALEMAGDQAMYNFLKQEEEKSITATHNDPVRELSTKDIQSVIIDPNITTASNVIIDSAVAVVPQRMKKRKIELLHLQDCEES